MTLLSNYNQYCGPVALSFHCCVHKMAAHSYCVPLVDPESSFLNGRLCLLSRLRKALKSNLLHFTTLITGKHNG